MTLFPDCPTCDGKGTVYAEVNMPSKSRYATALVEMVCLRCDGEGWLEVEVEDVEAA